VRGIHAAIATLYSLHSLYMDASEGACEGCCSWSRASAPQASSQPRPLPLPLPLAAP